MYGGTSYLAKLMHTSWLWCTCCQIVSIDSDYADVEHWNLQYLATVSMESALHT
jgi:hypothetical protein